MTALDILQDLRTRGVQVVLDDDRVVLDGPENVLTDDLICRARRHKPELIDLLRSWAELEAAIHSCCDARGDDERNRQALLADCWQEPASKWGWFAWYFGQDPAKWTH